ncbi:MAG: hypothetical protein ACK4VI_07610 [Alphaproteobacteria bacterium]
MRIKNFVLSGMIAGLCAMLLAGCGSSKTEYALKEPLTPLPSPVIDPPDHLLAGSVKAVLKDKGKPLHSEFEFQRIDLNNDGRRDALVLFKTPYGYWCGQHGCTMYVMQAHNDHFSFVSAMDPVRAPVYSSNSQTNGWRDIIVRVSGRVDRAKDVAVKFDGETYYPMNPEDIAPAAGEELRDRVYLFR